MSLKEEIADHFDRVIENAGDQEIILDPHAPGVPGTPAKEAGRLLLVTNVGEGAIERAKNIRLFKLDGVTGLLNTDVHIDGPATLPESGMLIASTYHGQGWLNGPEFFEPPEAAWNSGDAVNVGLGILFKGPAGVHGAFRPTPPPDGEVSWANFTLNIDGDPHTTDNPDQLPSSPMKVGDEFSCSCFPGAPNPSGLSGYQVGPWAPIVGGAPHEGSVAVCGLASYGDINLEAPLLDAYSIKEHVIASIAHPTIDRVLLLTAREGEAVNIYRGTIDDITLFEEPLSITFKGAPGLFHLNNSRRATILGGTVPGSGAIIWFVADVDAEGAGNDIIYVMQENGDGSLCELIRFPGPGTVEHFRVISNERELVLYYLNRKTVGMKGSWAIVVKDDSDGVFKVSMPYHFTPPAKQWAYGTELLYLPYGENGEGVTGSWAYYGNPGLNPPTAGRFIVRCWLTHDMMPEEGWKLCSCDMDYIPPVFPEV